MIYFRIRRTPRRFGKLQYTRFQLGFSSPIIRVRFIWRDRRRTHLDDIIHIKHYKRIRFSNKNKIFVYAWTPGRVISAWYAVDLCEIMIKKQKPKMNTERLYRPGKKPRHDLRKYCKRVYNSGKLTFADNTKDTYRAVGSCGRFAYIKTTCKSSAFHQPLHSFEFSRYSFAK